MKGTLRLAALLAIAGLVLAACSSAATPAPSVAPSVAASVAASAAASVEPSTAPSVAATVDPNSLLGKVMAAGKIRVSTDPNYAPQSAVKPDGTYEGFDIDVATEIAKRLGVKVEFVTPKWEEITAGGWGGRWDMSVGSMTITTDRQKVLDFSPPYYFTPAQMAASKASGITTLEGLAGKKICVGASTTYLDWLTGKKLDFGSFPGPTTTPPAGVTAVTQQTDADCAQLWAAGRNDWAGWLTAAPTVEQAIKANQPVVPVGSPVYFEPLAVAIDKNGPSDTEFLAKVSQIITDMHADGTLTQFSTKWYGIDLTKGPTQ